jgi:hypothetical protein
MLFGGVGGRVLVGRGLGAGLEAGGSASRWTMSLNPVKSDEDDSRVAAPSSPFPEGATALLYRNPSPTTTLISFIPRLITNGSTPRTFTQNQDVHLLGTRQGAVWAGEVVALLKRSRVG